MRKEYDFTGAKRAKDVPHLAKLQAAVARGKSRGDGLGRSKVTADSPSGAAVPARRAAAWLS